MMPPSQTRPRYPQGTYPQIGDLVSKECATPNGDGSFIQVTGFVLGMDKQLGTPIVHWAREGYAYGMHPMCLTLIKRGKYSEED